MLFAQRTIYCEYRLQEKLNQPVLVTTIGRLSNALTYCKIGYLGNGRNNSRIDRLEQWKIYLENRSVKQWKKIENKSVKTNENINIK